MTESGGGMLVRRWRLWTLLFWLLAAAYFLWDRSNAIRWFALVDTDDNLRMMQVRAWIAGQDWYDLRQYRLSPPEGLNVHWSRIVDLPIAGLILALKPFFGGRIAEQAAVAVAPLIPMAVAMLAVAATARRLVDPRAFAIALALLLCAGSARGMWTPLRIDHHGWQLAMLSLVMLALTDDRRARGGALLGVASAVSLSIGFEMLIYLALAGATTVLLWVWNAAERPRLAAYGASLAGGCALGFLLFTSTLNRAPVCDALSPVWLSAMIAAGAIAVALASSSLTSRGMRFAAAAAGGALLAIGFAVAWPDCLGRLEGVSTELEELWLSRVREARPIYTHDWPVIVNGVSLPLAGLAGYALMLWQCRRRAERLLRWAPLAVLAAVSAALLLWQTRAGPAAQLLSIPGAAALAWVLLIWSRGLSNPLLRVGAAVGGFLIVSGVAGQMAIRAIPREPGAAMTAVSRANARCPTLAALRPVALQPRGRVLTFVDLGPRLVTVTHHDAIAGPYHRNETAILDVMHAFRGNADEAQAIVARRGIDYVLICPNMSESTLYRSGAPNGFYVQLARGQAPDWLEPVAMPKGSPYRMWRVRPGSRS